MNRQKERCAHSLAAEEPPPQPCGITHTRARACMYTSGLRVTTIIVAQIFVVNLFSFFSFFFLLEDRGAALSALISRR